ncbi:Uncharacterized membrane protein YsdA, DUF1294 family [Paenibacillus catalpae]|uniref:Uncharacterized membrane protein YsdA, DUF1294 family n=1 Tax=Paenibacillus catalpae TaxID=1045775 RepID=A0A1I1UPT0_9BACL|nr:DUF1294 domain-containing protein [Paenibacillus catalpae]SFD70793.1 Uncharacterized membrane protein YsdA, DUF1294 family [Paenibacillus catalpae]
MQLLIIYLLVINIIAFVLMGMDKSYARHKKRRVPEKRLFGISAIGGALGAWIGMQVWRHKTKHTSFRVGIPLLFIFNLVVIYYLMGLIGMNFESIA